MSRQEQFDLAIVGAGIVGLAHALAAARRGKRVVVIDRDAQANGASVRNFGFVTVTGQERGQIWRRAMRSRDVWLEVAGPAGIDDRAARPRRRRAAAGSARRCSRLSAHRDGRGLRAADARASSRRAFPMLAGEAFAAALWSPHELRVESRTAIPRSPPGWPRRTASTFLRETAVRAVEPPRDRDQPRHRSRPRRRSSAPATISSTLFPERIARLRRHALQAAHAAAAPTARLAAARGGHVRPRPRPLSGYAALPEAAALKARLDAEQRDAARRTACT